jgi:hypothetical protein
MPPSPHVIGLPLIGDATPEIPLYTADAAQLQADLIAVSRNRLAEKITGGLSRPGKMPTYAWGISAARCKLGSVLAEKPGTVCHDCYARKRNYLRDSVQERLELRYEGLFHPLWVPAMVFLVNYFCYKYFRLFDSGDLQDENHYKNVITMARHTPEVVIWMPTREIQILQNVHREMVRLALEFPQNLIPRVSANKINGPAPRGFQYTSAVVSDQADATCVAQLQGNKCDGEVADCRACWTEKHVTYPLH